MAAPPPAINIESDVTGFHPPPEYAAPPPPGGFSHAPGNTPPPKKGPSKDRLAQLKNFHRAKSSSTSTIYANSTVSSPDMNELLRCIAMHIQNYINQGYETPNPTFIDIFDERKYPLTREVGDLEACPVQDDVYKFIDAIFDAERLSAECSIMMLAYIDRVREKTNITMHGTNWRRVVLSTLILASKVWEDQAVWNVDFLSVFPCVTVKDLGNLEKVLLRHLEYNVSLKASLYAKYYFELRSLAEQDERNFPLEPLDKEAAKRLETRSMEEEEKVKDEEKMAPRSKSVNYMKGQKTGKVVLS